MTTGIEAIWIDENTGYAEVTNGSEDRIFPPCILQPIADRSNIRENSLNNSFKVGSSWAQQREIEALKGQLEREEKRRVQAETLLNESRVARLSTLDIQAQLQAKDRTIHELQCRCEELEAVQHKSQSQVWQAQKFESSFRKELQQARAILTECEHEAHQLCGENAFLPPEIARRRSLGCVLAPKSPGQIAKDMSECKVKPTTEITQSDMQFLRQEIERQMGAAHHDMQCQIEALRVQIESNEKHILSSRCSEQHWQKQSNRLISQMLAVKAVQRAVVLALLRHDASIEGKSIAAKEHNHCTSNLLHSVDGDLHETFAAAASALEQAFETAGIGPLGLHAEFESLSVKDADMEHRLLHQEEKIAELQ